MRISTQANWLRSIRVRIDEFAEELCCEGGCLPIVTVVDLYNVERYGRGCNGADDSTEISGEEATRLEGTRAGRESRIGDIDIDAEIDLGFRPKRRHPTIGFSRGNDGYVALLCSLPPRVASCPRPEEDCPVSDPEDVPSNRGMAQ